MRKLILLLIGSLLLVGCATKPIIVTDNDVCSDLCSDINELYDLELQYILVEAISNAEIKGQMGYIQVNRTKAKNESV